METKQKSIMEATDIENFDDNDNTSSQEYQPEEIVPMVEINAENTSNDATLIQDNRLIYGVEDSPPWYLSILFGLQQVCVSLSATIAVPIVVSSLICAGHLEHARAQIISTFLVTSGVGTLLQSGLGVRLPILQGGSHIFILPVMAIMNVDKFRCPDIGIIPNGTVTNITNLTTTVDTTETWQIRMREIQGAIILASLTEMILGFTGVVGLMLYYIGPITITCTIGLIGISLYPVVTGLCQQHWGMTFLTVALILLFSVYINKINIPCPTFGIINKKGRCNLTKLPIFGLFPVILAVAISWACCGLLTGLGKLPDDPKILGYRARTDARVSSLYSTSWFFAPYPCQWGIPTISLASYLGMLGATVASIIESVGDYYAAARICGLPSLPPHAVNRGIALEGFGGIISGLLGSGGACTSYTENLGAICLTRVASRVVFVWAGIILVIAGVFGKVGALLSMIPDPVLGGTCLVSFGLVTSAGFSNLTFVDMSSSRNQVVIGVTFMIGLIIPNWINSHPEALNTGSNQLDQTIQVLLGTPVFVGGVMAFILDNSVPGTLKERGLITWRENTTTSADIEDNNVEVKVQTAYNIPLITKYLKGKNWSKYVPILPTYKSDTLWKKCRCAKCENC